MKRSPAVFDVISAEASLDGDHILVEVETEAHAAIVLRIPLEKGIGFAHAVSRAVHQGIRPASCVVPGKPIPPR